MCACAADCCIAATMARGLTPLAAAMLDMEIGGRLSGLCAGYPMACGPFASKGRTAVSAERSVAPAGSWVVAGGVDSVSNDCSGDEQPGSECAAVGELLGGIGEEILELGTHDGNPVAPAAAAMLPCWWPKLPGKKGADGAPARTRPQHPLYGAIRVKFKMCGASPRCLTWQMQAESCSIELR